MLNQMTPWLFTPTNYNVGICDSLSLSLSLSHTHTHTHYVLLPLPLSFFIFQHFLFISLSLSMSLSFFLWYNILKLIESFVFFLRKRLLKL